MSCDPSVDKGSEAVLLAKNAANTAWEIIGGIQSRDSTTDNPTAVITSSSTVGSFNENEFTGYSDDNMSISGVMDKRAGEMRVLNGVSYAIARTSRLDQIQRSTNRCGEFKVIYSYKEKEGFYTVTSYGDSGDTTDHLKFTATLQNKGQITTTDF